MGLDQYIYIRKSNEESTTLFHYFRKVNCLQGYFENKFDIQNCDPFKIEKYMIEEIIYLTDLVLEAPASGPEHFPIQTGFFYGNYEYNDHYMEDVKETNTVFKQLLNCFDEFEEVYYNCWY